MNDKNDTTIVHTGSGASGWFVAVVILLLVAGGGFYLYHSSWPIGGSKEVNVDIKLPAPPPAPSAE